MSHLVVCLEGGVLRQAPVQVPLYLVVSQALLQDCSLGQVSEEVGRELGAGGRGNCNLGSKADTCSILGGKTGRRLLRRRSSRWSSSICWG